MIWSFSQRGPRRGFRAGYHITLGDQKQNRDASSGIRCWCPAGSTPSTASVIRATNAASTADTSVRGTAHRRYPPLGLRCCLSRHQDSPARPAAASTRILTLAWRSFQVPPRPRMGSAARHSQNLDVLMTWVTGSPANCLARIHEANAYGRHTGRALGTSSFLKNHSAAQPRKLVGQAESAHMVLTPPPVLTDHAAGAEALPDGPELPSMMSGRSTRKHFILSLEQFSESPQARRTDQMLLIAPLLTRTQVHAHHATAHHSCRIQALAFPGRWWSQLVRLSWHVAPVF